MPKINLNPFNKKSKKEEFIAIEIGLEKISAAIFAKENENWHRLGIGRKEFIRQEEVFDGVLEALDSLASQVKEFPQKGVLGISGGSLETVTTLANYTRQKPKKPIDAKETEGILNNVAENLDTNSKKIFFSTIAGANVDGVKISNPLGLKGGKVELSCFVALKNSEEMELLDRLMNEIDVKIERIVPTSFAVVNSYEKESWENVLIIRAGQNKSEITSIVSGHISEILPVGLGSEGAEFLSLSWQNAILKLEKEKYPDLIWVYPETERTDLGKIKDLLESYNWQEKLGFKSGPKIEEVQKPQDIEVFDLGIEALGKQGV